MIEDSLLTWRVIINAYWRHLWKCNIVIHVIFSKSRGMGADRGQGYESRGRGRSQGAGVRIKGQGCSSRGRWSFCFGSGAAALHLGIITGHLPTAFLDHAFVSIYVFPEIGRTKCSTQVDGVFGEDFYRCRFIRRSRPAAFPLSIWPNTLRSQKHDYWSQHTRLAFVFARAARLPSLPFPLACFTYFVLGSFFGRVDTFDQHWHIDGLTSYGVLSSFWIVTYYDTWAAFTWLLHWHATKQNHNDLLSWCFQCYVYYVHILLAVNFPIVRRILK